MKLHPPLWTKNRKNQRLHANKNLHEVLMRGFSAAIGSVALTTSHLHAAADITISTSPNSFITPDSPFRDIDNNGGTSNLNITTLLSRYSVRDTLVTTNTITGTAPQGGRILLMAPVSLTSPFTLTLQADSSIVLAAPISVSGGGSLIMETISAGVSMNNSINLSGLGSRMTVTTRGPISQAPAGTITVGGDAIFDAGIADITIGNTDANTANFGNLELKGRNVIVHENSSMLLRRVDANSLVLTSIGGIINGTLGNILVDGAATLRGDSIFLGGDSVFTSLGSINFNTSRSTGMAHLSVDDDMAITGSNSAGSVILNSSGTSTFAPASSLSANTLRNSTGNLVLGSNSLSNGMEITNTGTITVSGNNTVKSYTQNSAGVLDGNAWLTVTEGAFLNGGTVNGRISGDVTSKGTVEVNGDLSYGTLTVESGVMSFRGNSVDSAVVIAADATMINDGEMLPSTYVTNSGTLQMNRDNTVYSYEQSGASAILSGQGSLTAELISLKSGTVAGNLIGSTVNSPEYYIQSSGAVSVSGSIGGGVLQVSSDVMTLSGLIDTQFSITEAGATLRGTGVMNSYHWNYGTLAVGAMGEDLESTNYIRTEGTIELNLEDAGRFEKIIANGMQQGGTLKVTNVGTGLAPGQAVKIIDAKSYFGKFEQINAIDFQNGVIYDDASGTLIGLGGGELLSDGYFNLNGNQSNVYLALFENAVDPDQQNVFIESIGDERFVQFQSGASSGPDNLVRALTAVNQASSGVINQRVVNQLSPEAHYGMADYSEEAIRSHVRKAIDAPVFSRSGKMQLFATLHTTTAGTDQGATNAGYEIDTEGITLGARYDVNQRFQAGVLLGVDHGDVEGPLIDTDAQGLALGVFGRFMVDHKSKTMITGAAAMGSYSYDATRRSFEGDAMANDIGASAIELSLGVSTVLYEKDGVTLTPNATLRYFDGSVDGFKERGNGVNLRVDSQDINSVIVDLGIDATIDLRNHVMLHGRLGYMHEFTDSDESVRARFAFSGLNAVPFSVNALGIDHQAFVMGVGMSYDLAPGSRMGISYLGEYRLDARSSQNLFLHYSLAF